MVICFHSHDVFKIYVVTCNSTSLNNIPFYSCSAFFYASIYQKTHGLFLLCVAMLRNAAMSTIKVCAAVAVWDYLGYMPGNGILHLFFIKKM